MSALTIPPNGVLAQPPCVRVQYFKDFAVAHPLLVEAKDRLLEAITESAPNSLILVSGPTGVGKTTLLARVRQLLSIRVLEEMKTDPARLPVVTLEATPSESRSFSWRSHFKRLLREMNEPLIDCKRRLNPTDRIAQMMSPFPSDRGVTADYHYAVEQALRYRRPHAVLIDEAQHLFALASGRRLEDQLNVLKSLANRSNTVHVLCGTYELLRIRNLSGQLSRRSIDIHFPRYDVGKAPDRRTFAKVLQTFAEQMPLPEPPDLIKFWEYLYERSIGCVGILKDWLVRGLSAAIGESAPTVTLKHLERHALSVSQCDRLIEEATRGESQFREDADARSRLLLRLGFPEPVHTKDTATTGPTDRPRQQRPGQRCPKRDVTGTGGTNSVCQTV
ncbi:MAG: ATP-binding protein [Acidobacteria bacterium]|nr:ATP-binding protein [Acidobacteriota bacterium]